MGVLGTEYLRLSPGELERYTKEASREVRLKRLHEARRQASLLAQQQRQSNQQHRRVEEKALKTVEVRAELAAKRVQLQGLLKLKEACDQEKNAMESARLRQVEDEARRCAAEALEAERQKQEALRCLEACRQRKAWQSLKAEEAAVRQKQRQEVKAVENRRARRAASLGRATKEAEKLVEKRWEDEKVLKTDVSGLQQLSKTCVQVLHEVSLEAEEQPRRRPAPEPSPAQREAARSRGREAQRQLRAEREEKDAERERLAKEKKERQDKAAAVAARARLVPASWTDELLPWRILNTSKAAEQLSEILAPPSDFALQWVTPAPRARSQPVRKRTERCAPRPKTSGPKTPPVQETPPCTVTWLGPATVWPTVGVAEEEVVEDQYSDGQCKAEVLVPEPDAKGIEMDTKQNEPPASSASSMRPSTSSTESQCQDATSLHPPEKRILLPAPRPSRPSRQPKKLGEEDLALRLDDICRELEEVGLCAWEADDELI
mmetsp:Transcript_12710/g.21886  ORF Transcript_12710/g.21886 Transcript_12710/m.21886 type:complete len:491 (+) Transcript_12710:36-1508(+)